MPRQLTEAREQAHKMERAAERQYQKRQGRAALLAERDGLRADLAQLRAEHDTLQANLSGALEALVRIVDSIGIWEDKHADAVQHLRTEVVRLGLETSKERAANLDTLHANLVRSAEATINSFHEMAAQRREMTERETAQHEALQAAEAKAEALAKELAELREAHKNFRFAREQAKDGEIVALPPAFLKTVN